MKIRHNITDKLLKIKNRSNSGVFTGIFNKFANEGINRKIKYPPNNRAMDANAVCSNIIAK